MKNKMECKKNIKAVLRILDQISVEPTLFLYMMGFMFTSVIEQVFFVYKACRVDHGYAEQICRNIEKHESINTDVQKTVAIFYQWEGISSRLIPIVLAIFLGPWSDRHGRKIFLIIGLFGKLIYAIMIIVNANQPTWPLNYVLYTATIPCCLTGADMAIFASCYAYISDITSVESRTLRITILDSSYLITMPAGVALGAHLYKLFDQSFSLIFACNGVLMILAIIYSLMHLKWKTTDEQKTDNDIKKRNMLLDFFDKDHALLSLKTMTKKRDGNHRVLIWLLLITISFYTFQRNEIGVLFLYTQLKLNWDTHIYSWFRTYQSSILVVITLIGIPVMTKILKWPDTILVLFGSISNVLGRLFLVFAQTSWMMYLGASVASLGPITASVIRSMLSKLLPTSEFGVIFAVLSMIDNAVPLISAPIYSQLYNATIVLYPASIFWLTLITQAMVFILILIIHFALRDSATIPDEIPKTIESVSNPERRRKLSTNDQIEVNEDENRKTLNT